MSGVNEPMTVPTPDSAGRSWQRLLDVYFAAFSEEVAAPQTGGAAEHYC